jgi:hypothetical protein
VVGFDSCGRDSHGERQRSGQMTDLIERTFHWLEEELPGRVSRPGSDSYVASTANRAKWVERALHAVVHRQTPEAQSATQGKWNSSMPTNLKIVPRLLSFAAAAFVLLAVVNADAQQPTTRSVVIPPIPPGQARIWIYSGSQPTSPFNYPHMEAVTLNGVTVGYEQLGGGFYRNVAPGHYVIAAPSFLALDPSQSATVDLAAGQEAYLKLDALGWPNGGGENMVLEYYVRLMPPQIARTAIAQLAFSGGN